MIAFSGLDGAGKSTQINLLKKKLEEENKKVHIFWSRGGYTPGMKFLKHFIRKACIPSIPKNQGNSFKRDTAFKKNNIRMIWLLLSIIDLIIYYGLLLRIKALLNYVIICDRYLIDTLIDFKLNFPDEKVERWISWKLLELLAVKPNIHFILIVSVEESQRRSKLKCEPYPDTEEALKYRRNIYLEYIASNKEVKGLDGQFPISEVHRKIIDHLNENITFKRA